MDATPPQTFDADLPARRTIDPYAAIVDQLQRTVMQLVRATLDRARSDAGLAIPLRLAPRSAAPARPAASSQGVAPAALSQRECEVLQRIAAGDSNKMIARALELSPHTVKRHVANILDKLGARSRSQAAAWLQRAH